MIDDKDTKLTAEEKKLAGELADAVACFGTKNEKETVYSRLSTFIEGIKVGVKLGKEHRESPT